MKIRCRLGLHRWIRVADDWFCMRGRHGPKTCTNCGGVHDPTTITFCVYVRVATETRGQPDM